MSGERRPIVEVSGLSKRFTRDLRRGLRYAMADVAGDLLPGTRDRNRLRSEEFWALRDVNLTVRRGEAVGLIGSNGSGKSTLLRIIAGLSRPDGGTCEVNGRVGVLFEVGAGFDPVQSGRENVYVNGTLHGLSVAMIDSMIDSIVDFAELPDVIDAPVGTYSAGMKVRLGYAVAAHLAPDLMVVDEALAVGDLSFRRKCLRHMDEFVAGGGALMVVEHQMPLIQAICENCLVLDHGETLYWGDSTEAVGVYLETVLGGGSQAEPELEDPGTAADAGPVRLVSASLTSPEGGVAESGSPARVEAVVDVNETVDVVWGFVVADADQMVAITGDVGLPETHTVRLEPGRVRLTCRLPKCILKEGTYALRIAVLESPTMAPLVSHGWNDLPTPIRISASLTPRANLLRVGGVLVDIETEWEAPQ